MNKSPISVNPPDVQAKQRQLRRESTGADYGAQRQSPLPDAFTQTQRIPDTRPDYQKGKK